MATEKLISAEALLLSVRDDPEIDGKNFARFKEHIKHAPDAVKHGRWRKTYTCHGERLWGYECDQCKADSGEASKYCPNCGAKMDLPQITEQTRNALEKMGEKAHGGGNG